MADNKDKISFQGLSGAYSEVACKAYFPDMETISCDTFEDAFYSVSSGNVKYAMIPIENSQAGRVADIHNLLANSSLHIVGEHFQRVRHQLLGIPGAKISNLKTVYSHVQAVSQCRKFINSHNLMPIILGDTAGAAADVAKKKDISNAAIASQLAAKKYGLEIISSDIEDSNNNVTRFVIISKDAIDPDPDNGLVITSCIFKVRNIPAALYKALGGFATNRVNLLKLESYMIDDSFSSSQLPQFYVDIAGHPSDKRVCLALEELGFFTNKVKILGVYKAHESRDRD